MAMTGPRHPAASLLARLYIGVTRHSDGRAGLLRPFWSRCVDLTLRLRPSFRGLDVDARRRVYLEYRHGVENDPKALAAAVRFNVLVCSGVFAGGFAGDLAALTWLFPDPSDSAALDLARGLCVVLPSIAIGGLIGVVASRVIMSRTGPTKREWQRLLDGAFTRAGATAPEAP
jgi:hypothetical protein